MAPIDRPMQKCAATASPCPVAVRRRGTRWRKYKIAANHAKLSVRNSRASQQSSNHQGFHRAYNAGNK